MASSVSPPSAYEPTGGPGPLQSIGARTGRIAPSRIGDWVFKYSTLLFAVGIAGLVVVIIISMAQNSTLSVAKFGWSFVTNTNWDPVHAQFGAGAFIYGTIVSSVLAQLFAVPVSVGIAVFLVEQAPRRLSYPTSFLVQLLAAIPSVVYGMWGIYVLAPLLRTYIYPPIQSALGFLPFFQGPFDGLGLMSAGLILAVMIVPIVTAVSTDVLRAVSNSLREAAYAMGATKWEVTRVVLGAARSGISGAVILGLGRAIGETMAVTMVIGNRPEISERLFAPSYTISAAIANEFNETTSKLHRQSLVELGLILFLITFVINVLARLLVWTVTRGEGKSRA